jgi:hypothetical protein
MKQTKKEKEYQCPLCDETSGAIGTRDDLLEHLKEDHLDQEGVAGFVDEVLDAFLMNYAYVAGLRTALGLDKK